MTEWNFLLGQTTSSKWKGYVQKEVSETFETKVETNTFAYAKVVSGMNKMFVFGLATFLGVV